MDKEKLKKLKQEYNPASEVIFDSIWNIEDNSDTEIKENNDNIVNKLYKDLTNLTFEEKKVESSVEKKEEDVLPS